MNINNRNVAMRRLTLVLMLTFCVCSLHAETLRVDPRGDLKTINAAAAKARDGDIVEITAGDYRGDVAVWTQSNVLIKAVGGRARLIASGRSAEDKAIWVVRGGALTIENIEFMESRVPHRNGAGIRLEAGNLIVRNCRFLNNENGILTANNDKITLTVENSEFDGNGDGDGSGQTHNLYAGKIARLTVVGSYFHRAKVGHLLKSRAAVNVITYNRLTDEPGGQASYELEFPNGGQAFVIGNLIQQSSTTENSTIISFGAEGLAHPKNILYLSHNSVFDDRTPAGRYVDVRGKADVVAYNNLLAGGGRWNLPTESVNQGNIVAEWEDFALPIRQDYHPIKNAKWLGKAATIPKEALEAVLLAEGISLKPIAEYEHPMTHKKLGVPAIYPGALQSLAQ